jgi:ParB-like chromosome segregation protein Spo0J
MSQSEADAIEEVEGEISELVAHIDSLDDVDKQYELLNHLRDAIEGVSPADGSPIDKVLWVPIEKCRANSYNPNQVADEEMELLYKSIDADGYTQPVVVDRQVNEDTGEVEYEIVDGFHRYMTMKTRDDIRERTHGRLPVTLLDADEKNERRAATVRHNRARGEHSVDGKADVVFQMLDEGWEDEEICEELGMSPEELTRIKHTTGFSALFEDVDYQQAWKATQQLEIEKEEGHADEIP